MIMYITIKDQHLDVKTARYDAKKCCIPAGIIVRGFGLSQSMAETSSDVLAGLPATLSGALLPDTCTTASRFQLAGGNASPFTLFCAFT